MPKVTEKYFADKKKYILECAEEVLKEKPLYLITMRDIIKKAGFSQGAIYRYYADVDEIYIDCINRNTTNDLLEQRLDALICSKRPAKTILSESIMAVGEYIEELLTSVGGRTCFELIVSYAYDLEKRETVFPKLKFKQSLTYAQKRVVEFIVDNVEKGVFTPQIPIHSIVAFINVFIDGSAQSAATTGDSKNDPALGVDIAELFKNLAEAVVGFCGQ